MSQSRFWISEHPTYELAHDAKEKALQDNPDGVYQVRKGANKKGEVFRLVQRFKNNEATVIRDTKEQSVARGKKRKRKSEDFSWVGTR